MYQRNEFLNELHKVLSQENIKFEVPMKEHTTFRIGGNAEIFITPESYEEVRDTLKLCKKYDVAYYILGKGSNIIVRDGGVQGVIIKLSKLKDVNLNKTTLVVQGGASLIDVALLASRNGLSGLEFASGIPGSIGGGIAMNAGAYGGEISNVIKSAKIIDDNLQIKELSLEEMQFSYRNSIILKKGYIVLEATFELTEGDKEEIKQTVHDLTKKRIEKQPLDKASAGSTFKRPEGYFAGKLIQDSGLKGYKIGEAQVSEKHSGFIVNNGNATADEVLSLIKHVQDTVYKMYNVKLETEVRIIGNELKNN